MSRESLAVLNSSTLIGYTEERGRAWHYRAEEQGSESNHYPGPIPVEDVRRRLFCWSPVEADLQAVAIGTDGAGGVGVTTYTDPTRKVIVRPDTGAVLGVFSRSYRVHDFEEWLVKGVEAILDADVQIGSAGLLRGGAVAWVQVEMADTLEVEGVAYRPFLTATTSLDGSIATTYQTGAQVVVCDNTLSVALREDAARVKFRHTAKSLGRLGQVRDALGIVHTVGERFAAQVEALCAEPVGPDRWSRWLAAYSGAEEGGLSSSARTRRREQVSRLRRLWASDERVAPWAGTAYGVLAAANTYAHHLGVVRGASRAERNAERAVTGRVAEVDARALEVLAGV